MAIAFDNATAPTDSSGTSMTYSHLVTGTSLILFVGVVGSATSNDITGVTYNGVAMTMTTAITDATQRWTSLWYLSSPATGTHNVVASFSASQDFIGSIAASYTGVNLTGQVDNYASNHTGAVNNYSSTITAVAQNCWSVLFLKDSGTPGAGTGTTQRQSTASGLFLGDSNATITAGSAYTMNVSRVGSGGWVNIIASFSPFTPAVVTTTNPGAAFLMNFL